MFDWRVKLKRIIHLIKGKKKNQNNKDEIEKHNTMNLDWRMKLKTNKTFTKGQRKKLKIKRIRIKLEIIIFDKLRLNY